MSWRLETKNNFPDTVLLERELFESLHLFNMCQTLCKDSAYQSKHISMQNRCDDHVEVLDSNKEHLASTPYSI